MLSSCAGPEGSAAVTTEAPGITEIPETTVDDRFDSEGYLKDNLPDELDYKGETVTVLAWKDVEHEEFESEGSDGDIVMTSIYKRNCNTEERLGVAIDWIRT